MASPFLRIVSPDQVNAQEEQAKSALAIPAELIESSLVAHIRHGFTEAQNHRNSASGWSERLLSAMRVFKGEYSTQQLAEIKRFGGSEIYIRLTAVKARGATSLLRDIYLGPERPWDLEPTPDPTPPTPIIQQVLQLVQMEMQSVLQMGGPPPAPEQIQGRQSQLMAAAREAAIKEAIKAAKAATEKLDDLLVEGGFYRALGMFMVDLPLFPFACIKGPVVRIIDDLKWGQGGKPEVSRQPRMFWERVSPFDLWWTPGATAIEEADVWERQRTTRAGLNKLIGVPGYDEQVLRQCLQDHGRGGLRSWIDTTDAERAVMESREDPNTNASAMIDLMEYNGQVQGRDLLEYGLKTTQDGMPLDGDMDYAVQCWLIGSRIIKLQFTPSPSKRHPYYITSFEKVPGTVLGNGLPDILNDIQGLANAAIRALVNNMAIASGPQVGVDYEQLDPSVDVNAMYPWKVWPFENPDSPTSRKPLEFFQPADNSQALLGVYKEVTNFADEISAIPRYITGTERLGGAGRTASGLSMLMGNASKILQTVAANVDTDVIGPLLEGLYDMVMLTDQSGLLRGDENVRVRGVSAAIQRETERQRALEMLQITGNPIDMEIMGIPGRASLLRHISTAVGMDARTIVPPDEQLMQQMQQKAMLAASQPPEQGEPQGGPQGGHAGPKPGGFGGGSAQHPKPGAGGGQPRTNMQQQRPG